MIFFSVMFLMCVVCVDTSAYFVSRNHRLYYKNETEFLLKGINYSGFETTCYAPHGLWVHDLDYYLDFIANNNFNAIRLPFSYEFSKNLENPPQMECVGAQDEGCKATMGTLMDCFFQKALSRNLFIVIDFHTIGWVINEYPYGTLTKNEFLLGWDNVLDRIMHYPNLLGIDIKNEPHGNITWNQWGKVVNETMEHILFRYPDYKGVFFVQGIQGKDGCWGGNFQGLTTQLNLQGQSIVFSPHTYGVSVLGDIALDYDEDNFHSWFGFLVEKFDCVIILGESGGFFIGDDMYWHFRYANYLKKINQTSTFYWSLNPDSDDTHGLLNDDWTTFNNAKLHFLDDLQPHPTKINIK